MNNASGAQIGEASQAGFSYSWSPATGLSNAAISNPTANPATTTTYTVTKTNTTTGCFGTDDVTVTVNNTTVTAVAGTPFTKTCTSNASGAQIGEASQAGFSYSWSPSAGLSNASISNPTANPTTTTTYTVTKTNTTTGCFGTASVTVTVNNTPVTANAGGDFTKTCTSNASGAQIGEASQAGFSYSWSPATGLSNAAISNPTANPATTTTYTVTKTNTTTGCFGTDDVTVTVNNTPVTAVAGTPFTKTCTSNASGAQIGEASQAGFSYSWAPAAGLSNAAISNPTANPATTTTYTVTKTNTTTGCFGTASVTVTVNNTPVTANAGGDFTKTCIANTSGAQIGEASQAGFSYSWAPAAGLSATNVSNPTANPTSTTTYTVTKTNTTTGCFGTDDVTVTVNNTPVTAVAGSPFTINCTQNLSGMAIGEASAAGYTYSWSPTTGLSSPTASNPTATPTATTTYTVTKTFTSSGCFGTASVTVTVDQVHPTAAAQGGLIPCVGPTLGTLEITTTGSTPLGGNISYLWSSVPPATPTSATTATLTVHEIGDYTVTITNSTNHCTASATATATSEPCFVPVTYCSYTQGFWGNKNGLVKLNTGGAGGGSLLPITVGAGANTITFNNATYLNSVMPGGSKAGALSSTTGHCTASVGTVGNSCFTQTLDGKTGRIKNVLLSQTISLALNIKIDGNPLGGLSLGTTGCLQTNVGVITIDPAVFAYLGAGAHVSDLLQLANDVLGGVKTPGVGGVPSYSAINSAVDAFNQGFDECRDLLGYTCPVTRTTTSVASPLGAVIGKNSSISMSPKATAINDAFNFTANAYPNPYTSNIRFTIESSVTGHGVLEVYNAMGQKIQTVFDGTVFAGKSQVIPYNVPLQHRTNLTYRLTVNNKTVSGKLLNIR